MVINSEPDEAQDEPIERLLHRLYPSLRRFASVVAPREIAPDDLLQDALVGMLRRGVDLIDDPAAYARRAMVNLASNHRRGLGRLLHAMSRLAVDASGSIADHYPSDLGHLAALRPEARAVLYMQHVEGMPTASIAAVLNLTPAAVRQISSRARRALRDHIDHQEG